MRQLSSLRTAAEQELTRVYEQAGRAHDALSTAEKLAANAPHDADLASWVETLRQQVSAGAGKRVIRRTTRGPMSRSW